MDGRTRQRVRRLPFLFFFHIFADFVTYGITLQRMPVYLYEQDIDNIFGFCVEYFRKRTKLYT